MKLNELKLSDEMIKRIDKIQNEINFFINDKNMKKSDLADWNLLYLYISFINNIPLRDIDPDSFDSFEEGIVKIIDRQKMKHTLHWAQTNGQEEEFKIINENLEKYPNAKYYKSNFQPLTIEDIQKNLDFIKKYFNVQ